MKIVLTALAIVVAAIAFTGCAGSSNDPSMQTNRLVGTAWELSLVQTAGRERLPVSQPGDYRIAFVEENRMVVQVLRNRCVGHYNSTGRSLTLRLDCPSAGLPPGSIGRQFLTILSSATQFGMTSSGGEMFIDAAHAGGSLSFRRISDEQIQQLIQQQEG